jgi:hypothetical protein
MRFSPPALKTGSWFKRELSLDRRELSKGSKSQLEKHLPKYVQQKGAGKKGDIFL